MRKLFVAVVALVLFASPSFGQAVETADATASITMLPNLVVTTAQDMSFPISVAGNGAVASDAPAIFDVTPNATVAFSFSLTLPTVLNRDGNPGLEAVSISFPACRLVDNNVGGGTTVFDCATGIPSQAFADGAITNQVEVDGEVDTSSQSVPGDYSGVVTLTVTSLSNRTGSGE